MVDYGNDPEFLRNIRRHFVSISGTYVALDNRDGTTGQERAFCYSAFVVEICGRMCLVTAGHILQRINEAVEQKKLLKCALADFFSQDAIVKEPVPFPYEDAHRIVIDKDGIMDIGVIPLRDYFCSHLRANRVYPLPVAAWEGRRPLSFGSYALLGLPEERMDPAERMGPRGPQIGHQVTLTLVGVESLASPPPEHVNSPIPRFAGILRDGDALENVEGMSGGPILGINKKPSGGWEYAGVAVQGSWNRHLRMLFGTPLSIVVNTIVESIKV